MKAYAIVLVLALLAGSAFCQPPDATATPPGTTNGTNTTTTPPPATPPPATPPPPTNGTTPPPVQPPVRAPPPPSNTTSPPPAPAPVRAPPPAVPPTSQPPARAPPPAGPATPPSPGATPAAGGSTSSSSTTSTTTGSSTTSSSGGSGPSEADVLTFAYNLECLEANFYSCAATGRPLDPAITGNGPAPSSCTRANLTSNTQAYATEFAREETAHVQVLFDALKAAGANPVCPQVNIDTAFEAAAEAAFNSTSPLNPIFNPYANDAFFLHGAFLFEDLGASAYAGGVGLLSTPDYRRTATQIGNTESYHSAIIRTLLFSIVNDQPAYNLTTRQITNAIVSGLNILSGPPQLKYELLNDAGVSLSNVDSKALIPVATPTQVLKVVTLNAPAGNGGGFFPNNLIGGVKN